MDRTQLWGRRLLSGSFVVIAALGFRSVADGSGGGLLAGMTGSDSCLVGELTVGYEVEYVGAVGGYAVTGAHLSGPESCDGRTVQVTFTRADGSSLGEATGPLGQPSSTVLLDEPGVVGAAEVTGIAVVLLG